MKKKLVFLTLLLPIGPSCLAAQDNDDCPAALGANRYVVLQGEPIRLQERLNTLQKGQAVHLIFRDKSRPSIQGRILSSNPEFIIIVGLDDNGLTRRWRLEKRALLENIRDWQTPSSVPLDCFVRAIRAEESLRWAQKMKSPVQRGTTPKALESSVKTLPSQGFPMWAEAIFHSSGRLLERGEESASSGAVKRFHEEQRQQPAAQQEDQEQNGDARAQELLEIRKKKEQASILLKTDLPETQAIIEVENGTKEVLSLARERAQLGLGGGVYRRLESTAINLLPGQMASVKFFDSDLSLEGEVIDIAPLVFKVEVLKGNRKVWGLVYFNANFISQVRSLEASVDDLSVGKKIKWRFKVPIKGWSKVEGRILSVGETIMVEGPNPEGIPSRLTIMRSQLDLVVNIP